LRPPVFACRISTVPSVFSIPAQRPRAIPAVQMADDIVDVVT
jgi:hypothetical protein